MAKQIALYYPLVVITLAIFEGVWLDRFQKTAYDWSQLLANIGSFALDAVIRLLPFGIALPFATWAMAHRLFEWKNDSVAMFWATFFVADFIYYWMHRLIHRVRFYWAYHAIHHSLEQMDLSAILRIGAGFRFIGLAFFLVPLVWLGFSYEQLLLCLLLNRVYQFWVHVSWLPKLGWLEYVLNTPSHHRLHHAKNVEYLGCNYGGVLVIYDRIFGTFKAERAEVKAEIGALRPVRSYNPLYIEIHEYLNLWKDLRSARSLGEIWGYLFYQPGWKPDAASNHQKIFDDEGGRIELQRT